MCLIFLLDISRRDEDRLERESTSTLSSNFDNVTVATASQNFSAMSMEDDVFNKERTPQPTPPTRDVTPPVTPDNVSCFNITKNSEPFC